jgi:threonine/homoserine/homoserine lactone efflux protein
MFTASTLILFLTTSVLLILTPGPDILFAIAQGMNNGKKAGLLTAFGLAFGNIVHILAATLGIAAIFQTAPLAFSIIKSLGILYLFYLAHRAIKHRNDNLSFQETKKSSNLKMFTRGFIMNVLNPKVALFFLAYFPQFITKGTLSETLQMLILGSIFIVLVIIIFGAFGYFAGYIGFWLKKSPNFSKYMNIITAIVFIGLGVKIGLTEL